MTFKSALKRSLEEDRPYLFTVHHEEQIAHLQLYQRAALMRFNHPWLRLGSERCRASFPSAFKLKTLLCDFFVFLFYIDKEPCLGFIFYSTDVENSIIWVIILCHSIYIIYAELGATLFFQLPTQTLDTLTADFQNRLATPVSKIDFRHFRLRHSPTLAGDTLKNRFSRVKLQKKSVFLKR